MIERRLCQFAIEQIEHFAMLYSIYQQSIAEFHNIFLKYKTLFVYGITPMQLLNTFIMFIII